MNQRFTKIHKKDKKKVHNINKKEAKIYLLKNNLNGNKLFTIYITRTKRGCWS